MSHCLTKLKLHAVDARVPALVDAGALQRFALGFTIAHLDAKAWQLMSHESLAAKPGRSVQVSELQGGASFPESCCDIALAIKVVAINVADDFPGKPGGCNQFTQAADDGEAGLDCVAGQIELSALLKKRSDFDHVVTAYQGEVFSNHPAILDMMGRMERIGLVMLQGDHVQLPCLKPFDTFETKSPTQQCFKASTVITPVVLPYRNQSVASILCGKSFLQVIIARDFGGTVPKHSVELDSNAVFFANGVESVIGPLELLVCNDVGIKAQQKADQILFFDRPPALLAAARSNLARSKVVGADFGLFATVAGTIPVGSVGTSWSDMQPRKSSRSQDAEALTCQVISVAGRDANVFALVGLGRSFSLQASAGSGVAVTQGGNCRRRFSSTVASTKPMPRVQPLDRSQATEFLPLNVGPKRRRLAGALSSYRRCVFSRQAAAGFGVSRAQRACVDDSLIAAVATTQPQHFAVLVGAGDMQRSQAPKSRPRYICTTGGNGACARSVAGNNSFSLRASARLHACAKGLQADGFLSAAIASTKPCRRAFDASVSSQHSQALKTFSSDIFDSRHGRLRESVDSGSSSKNVHYRNKNINANHRGVS